jgi:2-hydroxychromene-2-carboxylate isomerase
MQRKLIFWYEFASTYSYLSAMRIDDLAARMGVEVEWRPFLLGPIFAAQGWTTSPFNVYPAKGRYMVRDIGRIAAERGLPFVMPAKFPANGLKAARLAIAAERVGGTAVFTRAIYAAQFGNGADIADESVLTECLASAGLDKEELWPSSNEPKIKERLRCNGDEAKAAGLFGAPSFTTDDGELFWGDDRLEQALQWAVKPK